MSKHRFIKFLLFLFLISIPIRSAEAFFPSNEPPTLKEEKNSEGYIINLKQLIKRSKNRIEQVDGKMKEQARTRRNQQRESKAREYYQQAMRHFDDNRLKEAQELWDKAIKITEHPEMKGYISESVRKSKKQDNAMRKQESQRLKRLEIVRGYSVKEVEAAYQTAVKLFKQKKYLASQEEFEQVEEMFPDHKATRSYLMIIEQAIQKEQQHLIQKKLKEESITKRKEKDAWRKKLENERKERDDKLKEQTDSIYDVAVKLYKARKFKEAKEKFLEVEWMTPEFKSTVKYLSRINKDIAGEDTYLEKEKEKEYQRQMTEEALAKKKETLKAQKIRLEKEKERQQRLSEEASFVYNAALSLYKKKMYAEAQGKFTEVQGIFEGYKSTKKYLSRIDKKLGTTRQQTKKIKAFENQIKQEKLAQKRLEEKKEGGLQKKKITKVKKPTKEVKKIKKVQKSKKSVSELYSEAVALYQKKRYQESQEIFLNLNKKHSAYRSTENYLALLGKELSVESKPKAKGELLTKEQSELEEIKKDADFIYGSAVYLFENTLYVQAREKFSEIEKNYPGYKSTRKYLAKINKKLGSMDHREWKEAIAKVSDKSDHSAPVQTGKSDLERLYTKAVFLYKKKQYFQAEVMFSEVKKINSEYKSTTQYLRRINKKVAKERKKQKGTKKVRARAVSQAKKEGNGFVQKAVEERQQRVLERAETKYNEAMSFYKFKNFIEAKRKFIEVEAIAPGYKSTLNYLARVDEDIARMRKSENTPFDSNVNYFSSSQQGKKRFARKKSQQEDYRSRFHEEAEEIYQQALRFAKAKQLNKAKEEFIKVNRLSPNYKKTNRYLARMDRDIKRQVKNSGKNLKERQKIAKKEDKKALKKQKFDKRRDQVENIYQQAISHYEEERLIDAKKALIRVDYLMPGYKSVKRYLDQVNQRIKGESAVKIEKKKVDQRIEQAKIVKSKDKAIDQKIGEEKKLEFLPEEKQQNNQSGEYTQKQYEKDRKSEKKLLKIERKKRKKRDIERRKEIKEKLRKEAYEEKREKERQAHLTRQRYRKFKGKQLEVQKEQIAVGVREDKVLENYEYKSLKAKLDRQKANKELKEIRKAQYKLTGKQHKDFLRRQKDIKKLEATQKKQQQEFLEAQARAIYKEGVELFKNGDLLEARRKMIATKKLIPGYKPAQTLLRKIDHRIRQKKSSIPQKEKVVDAQSVKEKLRRLKIARRERQKIQVEKNKKLEQSQKQKVSKSKEKLERVYAEALHLYDVEEYDRAVVKFSEFDALLADGQFGKYYLNKMHKRLAKDKKNMQKTLIKKQKKQIAMALPKEQEEPVILKEKKETYEEFREKELLNSGFKQKQTQEFEEVVQIEHQKVEVEQNRNLKQEFAESKAEVERVHKEALRLFKDEEYARAKAKFSKFERLLDEGQFSKNYLNKMRRRLTKDRMRMQKKLSKPQEKSKVSLFGRKPNAPVQKEVKFDLASLPSRPADKKRYDLLQLEEKIREEEQRLAEQEGSLQHLVQGRQEDLKNARQKVHKEFQDSLAGLYARAIKLFKKKEYQESRRVFLEIDGMQPGYKKTAHYLEKSLEAALKNTSRKAGTVNKVKLTETTKSIKTSQKRSIRELFMPAKFLNKSSTKSLKKFPEKSSIKPREHVISNALDMFEESL